MSLPLQKQEHPLTVSALTDLIKSKLEGTFNECWVIGEISNFKAHPSGHFYFSLKDDRATLSAVVFRADNSRFKFKLQDGLKVIAHGKLTVYPPRGGYQIVISRMEPEGLGALQLAFEQLKKNLSAEGLFDTERKRPLPRLPRTIGIVTSPSGAAIRDILNILNRRFSGVRVLIYPARVQGEGSKEEIVEGIEAFNKFFPSVDVMIVGRGGGSIEDLWAFNEEVVARAIYHSRIPIVSAVGHETDTTIADYVADLRAPTPSAAAELVVANRLEILHRVDQLVRRLLTVQSRLEIAQLSVDELVQRMVHLLERKFSRFEVSLERLSSRLKESSPQARLLHYRHRLSLMVEAMKRLPQQLTQSRQWKIDALSSQLKLLNPRAIMDRGYSIVRIEKTRKVVKKAADVQMGDKLLIELSKGRITARV